MPQTEEWMSSVENIKSSAEALGHGDVAAREALISHAFALITALETPSEFVMRTTWAEPSRNTSLQLAIDLSLFEQLKSAEGKAISAEELARPSGADPELVRRIMTHLAAMHVVYEAGVDAFKATSISNALTLPKYRDGIPAMQGSAALCFIDLPKFLKETNYKNPAGVVPSPLQYSHHTEREFYEWAVHENPVVGKAFNTYMTGYRDGAPHWIDKNFYPADERLTGISSEDEVLLIDIGGGKGHDLAAFTSAHPNLKGRLILQDKPSVLSQIPTSTLPPNIEKLAHDFNTPQPPFCHGARAYHLHHILHNWSDEQCGIILRQVAAAMKPGWSKLLIFESVVPDVGASWKVTSLDGVMMALCAAVERTEGAWTGLLKAAGLRISGIWTVNKTTESLIEAVLEGDEE